MEVLTLEVLGHWAQILLLLNPQNEAKQSIINYSSSNHPLIHQGCMEAVANLGWLWASSRVYGNTSWNSYYTLNKKLKTIQSKYSPMKRRFAQSGNYDWASRTLPFHSASKGNVSEWCNPYILYTGITFRSKIKHNQTSLSYPYYFYLFRSSDFGQ